MAYLRETIGFVGCGNMGRAVLSGLLSNGIAERGSIFVFEKDAAKAKQVEKEFGVEVVSSSAALVKKAGVIFLAVKPQDLAGVSEEIKKTVRAGQKVISILAGTPLAKLKKFFGNKPVIVRAMPNLGAQVGEGITAISGSNIKSLEIAETIFSGCGKVIKLSERYFDLVTAVSGSGPAYFFLLMELLSDIACKKGLKKEIADALAIQTALGAARLAQLSGRSPEELRKMVTSKKGTTEAALAYFEKKGFADIFEGGIEQAIKRSRELSKG